MQANTNIKVNRKHKDTLFRFLFGTNKENALSLYNAVNHTNYTNTDDLTFTTLEDVIYMKMKNDTSFLFARTLNLYEHQSSYNPNMPLRGLLYFADLYRKEISTSENLYGERLIKIPTPRYIVFYNGPQGKMPEETKKLFLSDAFDIPDKNGDFEWTATMININTGKNKELMENCKVLRDYSIFVQKVKFYSITLDLKSAVDKAVTECIQENVLKDVLQTHQKEVLNMCLTEFDEKKYAAIVREEGREEGRLEERLDAIRRMFTAGAGLELILSCGYSSEEIEQAKK